MALTREQMQRAKEWFEKKSGGRGCAVCGVNAWKIEEDAGLFDLAAWPPKGHLRPIRVVIVACRNCGQYLIFGDVITEPHIVDPNLAEEDDHV